MLKVGSLIVENGIVNKVHKILVEKTNDKSEKIIYYKPYFRTNINGSLDCSIPESSLTPSNIRVIASKEEITTFYKMLSQKDLDREIDFDTATQLLNTNDLKETSSAIKFFWLQVSKGQTVTKTVSDWFAKSINFVSEEISYITKDSAEDIGKKIKRELKKLH